jgi:hypothetical protein
VSRPTSVSSRRLSRGPSEWSVITVIFVAAALSLALSIHGLAEIRDAAIVLFRRGSGITLGGLLSATDVADVVLAAATLAALAVLVEWEWRRRAVSRMLAAASSMQCMLLLTIVVAWLGQAYLFPGVLLGGDTGGHISRFFEIRRALDQGTLPQWTNYQYLGEPLLGFTGPFTYMVGGAVDVLVRDPVITAKVILFSTHLAAGWLFYALLRRMDFSPLASLIPAICFAGSFALLQLFIFRGVFPQGFTILFLILVFYAAEGLMQGRPQIGRSWLIFTLSTGGLIINHQPHALFVGVYLALFGASSLALRRWNAAPGLKWVASAGLMGVAISAFAVIPIPVEANWVMIDPDGQGGLIQLQAPTLGRLAQLLIWRDTRSNFGTDYWAYLGVVLAALALLGASSGALGRLGKERQRLALAILPCFLLSFVLFDPVVRNIIFIVFFAGLYAAFGVERLLLHAAKNGRLFLFVLLAAILDTGSTSVQPVARTDKQFLIDAGRYLERAAPNERFLEGDVAQDGSFELDIGPNASPMSYYSMVQRVAGEHNMAATRVHNYVETGVKLAERDLRMDGRLGSDAESLMQMLNVTRVVCNGPFTNGCPRGFSGLVSEGPLGAVLPIPNAGPALFSNDLKTLAPPEGLDKPMLWKEDFAVEPSEPRIAETVEFLHRFVRGEQFDPASRMAGSILVRRLPRESRASPPDSTAWHPRVLGYSVGLQRVSMTIASDGYGWAQLAHPWYPASEVRINGRPTEPLEGSIGLMVVPIVPGINAIEIAPVMTPIRAATSAISIVSLLVAILAAGLIGHYGHRWRQVKTEETA